MIIAGHEVTFSRRRYGTTTFTWATLLYGGRAHSLGDPWPAVIFPRHELERLVSLHIERLRKESA